MSRCRSVYRSSAVFALLLHATPTWTLNPPDAFADPAPPEVHAVTSPPVTKPYRYPELTIHRTPSAIDAEAMTSDWPGFLGPHRDGHSIETKLRVDFEDEGPSLIWEMACGEGYAPPVVQGDRLIFAHRVGNETHVDCLHSTSGERFWRYSFLTEYRGRYIPDGGPRAAPLIDDDRVYIHGVEGTLHCLDLASGDVIWTRDISEEFEIGDNFFGVVASPIIHHDLLIQNIGAPGGPCVAAFDKHTGVLVWGAGREWGPSCASPVIAEVGDKIRLLVLTGGESRPPTGGLMILDPECGTVEFTYPFRSRTVESVNGATPIVGDGRIFITASYNTGTACIALNEENDFVELWLNRRLGMQFSTPIYIDGHLYAIDGVSDRFGAIVCIDPTTGVEQSRTDLTWDEQVFYRGETRMVSQSIGEGSLLSVDGRLLCLGDNGHLLWLEVTPEGTTVLERVSLFGANESWTPPVLSHGLLYVCQNKRERFGRSPAGPRLMCFDLRE